MDADQAKLKSALETISVAMDMQPGDRAEIHLFYEQCERRIKWSLYPCGVFYEMWAHTTTDRAQQDTQRADSAPTEQSGDTEQPR